jgi:hypothetical protein
VSPEAQGARETLAVDASEGIYRYVHYSTVLRARVVFVARAVVAFFSDRVTDGVSATRRNGGIVDAFVGERVRRNA